MTDPLPSGAGPEPRSPSADGECPSGAPPAPETDPSPGPPVFVRALLFAAFAAVAILGVARIHERVRGLEDFQVDLARARVERAPSWLPKKERASLAEGAASAGKVSIHDEGLPESVAGRLEADPRVARVLGARRRHPDAVEVLVELRRPVALVEAGSRVAAVDRDGILVPGDFRGAPLPRIKGGGADLPAPGKRFGRAVAEGASVAAALPEDLVLPLGINSLDVSGVEKGGGIVLQRRAAKGVDALAVEWGRAPSAPDAALDPPVEAKVARLRLAAERFPGLKGLKAVRLGFDDLVVVPL